MEQGSKNNLLKLETFKRKDNGSMVVGACKRMVMVVVWGKGRGGGGGDIRYMPWMRKLNCKSIYAGISLRGASDICYRCWNSMLKISPEKGRVKL